MPWHSTWLFWNKAPGGKIVFNVTGSGGVYASKTFSGRKSDGDTDVDDAHAADTAVDEFGDRVDWARLQP